MNGEDSHRQPGKAAGRLRQGERRATGAEMLSLLSAFYRDVGPTGLGRLAAAWVPSIRRWHVTWRWLGKANGRDRVAVEAVFLAGEPRVVPRLRDYPGLWDGIPLGFSIRLRQKTPRHPADLRHLPPKCLQRPAVGDAIRFRDHSHPSFQPLFEGCPFKWRDIQNCIIARWVKSWNQSATANRARPSGSLTPPISMRISLLIWDSQAAAQYGVILSRIFAIERSPTTCGSWILHWRKG